MKQLLLLLLYIFSRSCAAHSIHCTNGMAVFSLYISTNAHIHTHVWISNNNSNNNGNTQNHALTACSPFGYTILLLLNRQLHLLLRWNCPSIRASIEITLSTNIFTCESNSSHEHSIRINSQLADISINVLLRIS